MFVYTWDLFYSIGIGFEILNPWQWIPDPKRYASTTEGNETTIPFIVRL